MRGVDRALVETAETSEQELDATKTVDDFCARNRSLEFHYHSMSGEFFVAKSRFLGQDDQYLHLDAPHIIGKRANVASGKKIEIFVTVGSQSYTFISKVVRTQCRIKLNDYVTIHGLYIQKPTKVRLGQKRHELRLGFRDSEQIPIAVNFTVPDEPSAVPLDKGAVEGWITNLSAGGCNLHLDTPLSTDFTIGHPIFLGFTLPESTDELILQVEIRSIRSPSNGFKTRLGVKFHNWPNRAYLRRALQKIERFIAKIQREKLKKRKP